MSESPPSFVAPPACFCELWHGGAYTSGLGVTYSSSPWYEIGFIAAMRGCSILQVRMDICNSKAHPSAAAARPRGKKKGSASNPSLEPLDGPSGAVPDASDEEEDKLLDEYLQNPQKAQRDICAAFMEPVPVECLERSMPPEWRYRQDESRHTEWFRFRPLARLAEFPGLREYLEVRHRDVGIKEVQISSASISDIIDVIANGCDSGRVLLSGIKQPNHPLAKEPKAAGLFASKPIEKGNCLGLYSGVYVNDVKMLHPYLNKLTPEIRKETWTYDFEGPKVAAAVGSHTFHSSCVRSAMGGLNDYHSIADSCNVKKGPLIFGGVFPMVLFFAADSIAAGQECLVEYGTDWYKTFVSYNPWAESIFFGQKAMSVDQNDVLLAMSLDLGQRTRGGRKKVGDTTALMEQAFAKFSKDTPSAASSSSSSSGASSKDGKPTSSAYDAIVSVGFAPAHTRRFFLCFLFLAACRRGRQDERESNNSSGRFSCAASSRL
jgi:hypothetical protein